MTSGRRVLKRPAVFEVVVIVNFLIIEVMCLPGRYAVAGTIPHVFAGIAPMLVGQLAGGVLVRTIIAAMRGKARQYLAIIGTPGWITDTFRLLLFGLLTAHTYSWIKLTVPFFHSVLYDQQLWNLDRVLLFGISPTELILNLFSAPTVLTFFDSTYISIFFLSLAVAFAFFLSEPSRRFRYAFMTSTVFLMISGAWLYLLIPSLGPALRFPEVWLPYSSSFPNTHRTQVILFMNYMNVLKLAQGANLPIIVTFGVAAFPSLHVGFQSFVALWMRRVWLAGQIFFWILALIIFLGSMVTGWHYMIDGFAGLLLAIACYAPVARRYRINHWLGLQRAFRAASSS